MSEKIRITEETKIRVLAYSGLESEHYQGVPEAWVECFGAENQNDPDEPTFDQILYLLNVNIGPEDAGVMEGYLPIWHVAVLTFKSEAPVNLLLIREAELMRVLLQTHSPAVLMEIFFPSVKTSGIKAEIIDAQEKPRDNGASREFPTIVYEGWPSEELRENWLTMQQMTAEMADATGGQGRTDFTYALQIADVDIRLHFVYFVLNLKDKEFWWIQRDEMANRED